MEIENVAGIGFTAGRTAQQQRDFAIGDGVLGKVVVDDQRVLALVAEVLADGAGCVRRQIQHRSRLRCRGRDDDGVPHRVVLLQRLHDLGDGRALLSDGAVNADQVVGLVVDDRVQRDGCFAGLAVADDQLALSAANGDHGVDGLQAGHHRLAHRLAVDHAGGETLDGQRVAGLDRAAVVDRLAERVDNAADHGIAHGHAENLAGALDLIAFADLGVVAENHRSDLVFFKAHGQARDTVRELQQLAGHDLVEPVETCNAVAQGDHRSDFVDAHLGVVICDLLLQERCDFVCFDLRHACGFLLLD